jgi:hypothetical protein
MAPNLSHGWTFIMKTTSVAFTQIGKWRRFVPSGNTFGKASDTVQHMKEHWRN